MLGRIALRIAARQALLGKTLVDQNILDSQITALDTDDAGNARTDEDRPFISLYVDASKQTGDMSQRSLHKPGQTDFVIEIGIAAAMFVTDQVTKEIFVIPGIPGTDAAFEFYLDVVGRQVITALTDPNNEWAEIWRRLSTGIPTFEVRRMADSSNGARIAAHQMVMALDVLPDPVFGDPVSSTSTWAAFFDKAGKLTDPVDQKMVQTMQSLIGAPYVLEADQTRQRFGLTLPELKALMIGVDLNGQPANGLIKKVIAGA